MGVTKKMRAHTGLSYIARSEGSFMPIPGRRECLKLIECRPRWQRGIRFGEPFVIVSHHPRKKRKKERQKKNVKKRTGVYWSLIVSHSLPEWASAGRSPGRRTP
jgi:hypothetical protein